MKGRHIWIGALCLAAMGIFPAPPPLSAAIANDTEGTAKFDPPSGPMILTRTLRRQLPGGSEVMTMRSYEIYIRPEGEGYLIDGKLLDVQVHVPKGFEKLAEFERERRDAGLFPMRLDTAGRLIPHTESSRNAAASSVGPAALERLSRMGLPEKDARDAANFIDQISHNPVRTRWPDDLFHPEPGVRRESRSVTLSGGESGRVDILIDATRDRQLGLLATFRREVTTQLGTSVRTMEETWTLVPKVNS